MFYIGEMLIRLFKPRPTRSSSFSEFIRTASTKEKKRVYGEVLKRATNRQNQLMSGAAETALKTPQVNLKKM